MTNSISFLEERDNLGGFNERGQRFIYERGDYFYVHYAFKNEQVPFEFDITTKKGQEEFVEIFKLYKEMKEIVYWEDVNKQKETMLLLNKYGEGSLLHKKTTPRFIIIYGLKFLTDTKLVNYFKDEDKSQPNSPEIDDDY